MVVIGHLLVSGTFSVVVGGDLLSPSVPVSSDIFHWRFSFSLPEQKEEKTKKKGDDYLTRRTQSKLSQRAAASKR